MIKGIGASPGIALAKSLIVKNEEIIINKRNVIEIVVGCVLATGVAYMLKLFLSNSPSLLSIISSGVMYCIVFAFIMIVTKNEYAIKILSHVLRK